MATTKTVKASGIVPVPIGEVQEFDSTLSGNVTALLRSATFSENKTGSDGFRATGKALNANGHAYQINVQATRIHSGPSKDDKGNVTGPATRPLAR